MLYAALIFEGLCLAALAAFSDFAAAPGAAWKFTAAGLLAGAGYWAGARAFAGMRASPGGGRRARAVFWLAAVGFRLIVLASAPADDLWRYLWEGRVQLHGFNPYLLAPDAPALAHLRDASVWPLINHRDYAAIYPPLVEKLFAALAALGAGPGAHKALYGAADLGVCALVARLAAGEDGQGHGRAAWYAWNPLAVYEFVGAGHFDSLMLLALAGAALALKGRRVYLSAGLLGLAVALKIVPAVLLPGWAFALGWRRAAVALPLAGALLPATALLYGWPGVPIFESLKNFAYVSRLNDAVWWLFEATAWANPAQKNGLYQGAMFAACLALAVVFRRDWPRALVWVLGAALLLSPALHPWYVAWILPFAAWRGPGEARGWCVLSVSVFAYYLLPALNPVPGAPWREPVWLRLAIFGPPAVFVAHQWMRAGAENLTRRRGGAEGERSGG